MGSQWKTGLDQGKPVCLALGALGGRPGYVHAGAMCPPMREGDSGRGTPRTTPHTWCFLPIKQSAMNVPQRAPGTMFSVEADGSGLSGTGTAARQGTHLKATRSVGWMVVGSWECHSRAGAQADTV